MELSSERLHTLIPNEVITVIAILQQANFIAALTAGALRDSACGVIPNDYDIVTSASEQQVQALFPLARISARAGLCTYRSKGLQFDIRCITELSQAGGLSLFIASLDFSCNAIYWDLQRIIYLDSQSEADIKTRTIRLIAEDEQRLWDSPVRVLRAIRIANKIKGQLTASLLQAISQMELLQALAQQTQGYDNYHWELCKMLYQPHAVAQVHANFEQLVNLNILAALFPKINFISHKKIILQRLQLFNDYTTHHDIYFKRSEQIEHLTTIFSTIDSMTPFDNFIDFAKIEQASAATPRHASCSLTPASPIEHLPTLSSPSLPSAQKSAKVTQPMSRTHKKNKAITKNWESIRSKLSDEIDANNFQTAIKVLKKNFDIPRAIANKLLEHLIFHPTTAQFKDAEIRLVETLIMAGASPQQLGTLLHHCIVQHKSWLLTPLLKHLDVNAVNLEMLTPLALAIQLNDIDSIKILLSQHALKINWSNAQGNSYLHLAILAKRVEIVKKLIAKIKTPLIFISVNKDQHSPLSLAIELAHQELTIGTELLISQLTAMAKTTAGLKLLNTHALNLARYAAQLPTIQTVLRPFFPKLPAPPTIFINLDQLLIHALKQYDIKQLVLSKGFYLHRPLALRVLVRACCYNDTELLTKAIMANPHIIHHPVTIEAFIKACLRSQFAVIKILYQAGISINYAYHQPLAQSQLDLASSSAITTRLCFFQPALDYIEHSPVQPIPPAWPISLNKI